MSAPEYIYLVRHGESLGNVDWDIHARIPDWKIPLTDKGRDQATRAAESLTKDVTTNLSPPFVYRSPYYRARETSEPIIKAFSDKYYAPTVREDPRLREQDWGNFKDVKNARKIVMERDNFGTFFFRFPCGESGADVYNRVSTFLDTLWRDFEKPGYPNTAIIVSHGLTIRLFLMRWFHWTVEEYELLRNPHNCQIIKLWKPTGAHHYILSSKLKKRKPKE